MLTTDFLKTVVSTDAGYFCLALGNGSTWIEQWYEWPADINNIVSTANKAKDNSNVYFSSYLFKAPQSTKENVLPSRTIQADLDDADTSTLPKEPTVLVETSPGRHQAYWVLDRAVPPEEHEELSRKLTYAIPLCDRSGWALGRKVRIANTVNHKYLDGPKDVKVVADTATTYDPDIFEALPEVPQHLLDHYDPAFLDKPTESNEHPLEILERIKDDIPIKVYVSFGTAQPDRSEALWALMCWGFKCGLSRTDVFTLAKGSANNKFADLKHRADQDLAKDVLRAEHTVRSGDEDPRTTVYNLLKSSKPPLDRNREIFALILEHMRKQGEFLHTYGGMGWYIRRDIGRPISVSAGSEQLQAMLDIQFGLNYTETTCRYVLHGLRSYITTIPETATQSALAHYDPAQRHVLLHTGRREVLRITANNIEKIVDGAYNVVFPWGSSTDAFTPISREIDWGQELFGNGQRGYGSSVENITNMTPDQALALLKVWFLFLIFRNAANTKPIIAAFGQPGSGKTTAFKKVYTVLYGRRRSINAVTTVDDFDHATSNDPLVVLDNVDTWEKWLPDRLAVSAGSSDVIKRKLYTDTDTITLRRQAVIGVTAHNPKFGREDVADRFLLFSFERFKSFTSEELILADIYKQRNAIWGAVIRDVQKILSTPVPQDGIPQFRIEDFARYGLWIARAINCEDDFRAAIEDVKNSQQTFSLEEEGLLVGCILKFVGHKQFQPNTPYTATELWSKLEGIADDPRSFTGVYRNSVVLSKKLAAMQASLQKIIDIKQDTNDTGNRVWMFAQKAN